MELDHDWVNPTNKETKKKYGRTPICICGKPFHKDKWQEKTELLGHIVSTVHLELSHSSNTGFDNEVNMWYETMIFKIKTGKALSFQVRYEDKTKALEGHELACKLLPNIIENPDKYPTDIITALFKKLEN